MGAKHTSTAFVRAYLLGSVDDAEATRFEEEYMCDPARFDSVWHMEDQLIAEYLKHSLSNADRERFEQRYLKIPALTARVREVEARVAESKRTSSRLWLQLGTAAALLVCCLIGYQWWSNSRGAASPAIVHNAPDPPVLAALEIRLSPGAMQGAANRQAQFTRPARGKVRLVFDLPGHFGVTSCRVILRRAPTEISGQPIEVWRSGSIESQPAIGGQEVRVTMDSVALPAGDYIAQAVSTSGEVLEAYTFRVNEAAK